MSENKRIFKLTALSAAMLVAYGSACADDSDVNTLIKPDSKVSIGIGNWSTSRVQQGTYDAMRDRGGYGLVDVDVIKRNDADGTWWKIKANNLLFDNREIRGEYLRQGAIGASFTYDRISRDDPKTYTTRLQGIGSNSQIVSTAAVPGPLQAVNLGTVRDALGLGFYLNLAPDLDFNVSFKNEDKKGARNWGRGSAPEFAVEPISSSTRQLEATLSYTTKALQLAGGIYGSWYNNKYDMVTINTAGLVAPTYLSVPLDNKAYQLFLNGGYSFTPTTRGLFKIQYSRATQNEHLPMKDIAGLSLAGSPDSLQGDIKTSLIQLGVTSRPLKELSLVANLRYNHVKDLTPVARYVQTNAACAASQCVDNTPLSYKTMVGKLEGTYLFGNGYSATAGLEDSRQDRTVPLSNANGAGGADTQRAVPWRARLNETTVRLELRRSLSETLNGSVSYLNSARRGGAYTSSAAGPAGAESDLINPINIADRNRNSIRLAADWLPIEDLSIQFNVNRANDAYPDNGRAFGLKSGKATLYGVDANYKVNDKWKTLMWYTHDNNVAKQLNTRAAAGSIKDNRLEDTGDSIGLGIVGDITGKINFGANLQWTRNVNKYEQVLNAAQTAGLSANLAPIENVMTRLNLFATYAVDKSSELRFDFINERWKTNDWTWMFADGTPFAYRGAAAGGDGTTVTFNPKQTSSYFGARYIFKFQ